VRKSVATADNRLNVTIIYKNAGKTRAKCFQHAFSNIVLITKFDPIRRIIPISDNTICHVRNCTKSSGGNIMNTEKIVFIAGLILALATALVNVPYAVLALIVLGLVHGVIGVDAGDRQFFFVTAIALAAAAGALAGIPELGKVLTQIISNISLFINAAVIAIFVQLVIDEVKA
jgi:hypothetical protein